MDKKRCPKCGALNVADAQWCNQCLTSFAPPPPPPPQPEEPQPVARESEPAWWEREGTLDAGAGLPAPLIETPASTTARAPQSSDSFGTPLDFTPPQEAVGTQRGAFVVKSEGVKWTCSVCEAENPLSAQMCSVCGTTFAASLSPKKQRVENKDPGTATLWSMFLPGAGHAYIGQWAQAWARGILSLWVVLVILLAGSQGGLAGSGAIPIMFGVIAFALWIVNAHDAYREANNEPSEVILKGRMFMWAVLGILGLLMLMLFSAAFRARGG